MIAAVIYAVLSPLSLMNCFQIPISILLSAVNFPLDCARNMVEAKQLIVM